MSNVLYPCNKPECWIPDLLRSGFVALWPQRLDPETRDGYYIWSFYVQWEEGRQGTHQPRRLICSGHHEQVLKMYQEEGQRDLREQMLTDSYLAIRGRI